MSDFELLLVVLGGLYLSESLLWVRRGTVVLRALAGRRFRVMHPSAGFGSTGVGLVLLNPLPPLGTAFLCHQWPLSVTPEAVCSFVPNVINVHDRPTHLGHHVFFADVEEIAHDGRTLTINGKAFARVNSERMAEDFAGFLGKLRELPEGRRGAAIDAALAEWMSVRRVRRRVRRYRRESRVLRVYSHGVLVVLFGAIPACIGLMQFRPWLPASLAVLVALLAGTAATFFAAHRRLFPGSRMERWKVAATLFLAPTNAIRANDALSRELLAGSHPAAAALEVCGAAERRAFLRRILLDVEHPMSPRYPSDDPGVRATVDGFQSRLKASLHGAIAAAGEDVAALLAAPAAEEAASVAYCPRCDAQYVRADAVCGPCNDMALAAFAGQGTDRGPMMAPPPPPTTTT
ncbi:MAG TPA: hypothetical protein VH253_03340 [Phycisphaerae bacterium]|nr:hypothetical protein [Phycisphaerae bacterium]